MADRRPFTITKVVQDEHRVWHARVTDHDGRTYDVHNRWGSWLAEVRAAPRVQRHVTREVLPHVAKALQSKVRRMERGEGS